MARHHLVLVPGFVGFDLLGQLAYYAGVTERFHAWRKRADANAVLHYFDNLPTASVTVRAQLLAGWLAKRLARGEIGPRDRVTLVGHSTGGLDIRRALVELTARPGASFPVDGGSTVTTDDVLARVRQVVFLSVPHYGTNLADFVVRFEPRLQAGAGRAAHAVWLNRGAVAAARRWLLARFADSPSHVVLAVLDALDETDEYGDATDLARASARTARAELAGWLDQVANDLAIVGDLRCATGPEGVDPWTEGGRALSPAQFTEQHRRREIELWRAHGLYSRSYATWVPSEQVDVAPAAHRFVDVVYRANGARSVATSARIGQAAIGLLASRRRPSLLFDVFFRACADPRGPFRRPPVLAPVTQLDGAPAPILRAGDNDGVVNTLSMLWPYDDLQPDRHSHALVESDHGDIIGHYALRTIEPPVHAGRRHTAYDFFQGPGTVDDAAFARVWDDLFTFATSA